MEETFTPRTFGSNRKTKSANNEDSIFLSDSSKSSEPSTFTSLNDIESIKYSRDSDDDTFIPEMSNSKKAEEIKNQDSNFIFFFGTAESGKSVILSSMLYALRTKFGVLRPKIGTRNSKEATVLLADFFENMRKGILPGRTSRDQVTRMDLVFEPNNKSKKVFPINLTFLETSGENHNEIRRGGDFHSSIDQYLRANIPLTFILVTSYTTAHQEDAILSEFLYRLEEKSKNLKATNVVLVISKWDKSGSQETSGEDLEFFIKERLPMTNSLLDTYGLSRTYYTIGELEKVNGEERIVELNLNTAEILSKWLYKSIAKIPVDYQGTFWENIKWSLFGK